MLRIDLHEGPQSILRLLVITENCMLRTPRMSNLTISLSLVSWLVITFPAASHNRDEASSSMQQFKGIVAPARSHEIAPPFDGQVHKYPFCSRSVRGAGYAAVYTQYNKGGARA